MNGDNLDPTYAGEGLYRENILDHFKNPRNFGSLDSPHITHKEFNPVCGDQIEIQATLRDSKISQIRFRGRGCAISQSAASMLTEEVQGKPLEAVKQMTRDDMLAILSIPIGPVRIKCAMLSLDTLKNGIKIYQTYQANGQGTEVI